MKAKPNRKRNHPIYLMVTERERELIARKMEQAGSRNMGAYLRKMAIDGLVVRLLRITSDNVNQIAKRANETRSIYAADVVEFQSRYDSLWNQTEEILRGLAQIKA
jgi:hypothetical protein